MLIPVVITIDSIRVCMCVCDEAYDIAVNGVTVENTGSVYNLWPVKVCMNNACIIQGRDEWRVFIQQVTLLR